MSDGPSEHLSWEELRCTDGTEYPQEWRKDRAIELATAFEAVRAECGFPLIVDSGFRTFTYNHSIGGALKSQHCEGRAVDLRPPSGLARDLQKLRLAAFRVRGRGLLRGIGTYDGFVHIDTRPGQTATWSGGRSSN